MPTKAKASVTTEIEQLRVAEAVAEATPSAVVLPYWPVWAAAQFASQDDSKALLQFVHVHHNTFGGIQGLQIEATDGHRAFRYRLPALDKEGLPTLWRLPTEGLLLQAKPLRKAVTTARLLTVTDDLKAVFHGGKGNALLELSSVNCAGHYSVHTLADCSKVGSFPHIDQLWPDNFSNKPAAPWAFNARYLRECCAVMEKLSANTVVRFQGNGPTTPFVLSSSYAPCIGQHFSDATLELLLMPVQIRR